MQLAAKNAEQAFQERKRSREETEEILERLQHPPLALQGRRAAWSASTSRTSRAAPSSPARWRRLDGEADKSRYRRYRLRTVTSNDDFASMYEILKRRFLRGARRAISRT